MKTIKVNHSPATIFLRLFLLASFLISPLNANYAAQAKEPARAVEAPALTPGNPLPRTETLYFNGQQWGTVSCWNPYSNNCNNAMAIAQQDNARVTLFETPYIFNMLTGEQFPLLAEGPFTWNDEHSEITFRIKPAAHWSDGTPVTAEDVAYTWVTNANYRTAAWVGYQDYIDTIDAVDFQTVVVKAKLDEYNRAVNPLMVAAYLSTNYVIQKAWTLTLEQRSNYDANALLNDPGEDVVYSGPYHKFFADDSKVVLIRNDNYWGQDASMWGKLPAPKYLAHIIYPDNDSGTNAFLAGGVDVGAQFVENVQDLWQVDHLPISTYLPDAPYQIGASLPTAFYNLNSYGLNQLAVRKAIAIAVNYDEVVANAMTNQSATFEQVPRSLMNPSAGEQALYDHSAVADLQWTGNDIAGANALLDEAGIIDTDGNGIREYNGQDLHYVATCPNGWLDWQRAIEVVAAAGQKIGIDITTNYPEWSPDYQNAVTNWPLPSTGYDIFMMWSDGAGPTQPWSRIRHLMSSEYAGTSGNWSGNWGGYSNPAADDLIRAIPQETDTAKLKADYTELTRIYLTDIPSFTVMYRPQSFHTVNESVWTGFPKSGDGTNPPVPPLNCTDGYSIACLYNLTRSPNPPVERIGNILANPQRGYVEYGNCTLDLEFTLTVVNGETGETVYTSNPSPCVLRDDGYHQVPFQIEGYVFKPGDLVTVSNGTEGKDLTITPEGTHSVDVLADIVNGVNMGATHLGVNLPGKWLDVYPNPDDGSWLADFTGLVDIVPGMQIAVYQEDSDGDYTNYGWNVPNPYILAIPSEHVVYGMDWPLLNTELTLTIQGYTDTSTTGVAPWDPNTIEAQFDLAGHLDLVPGDEVTISGGGFTKTLTITNITVTKLDVVNDTISGTASPGGSVTAATNNVYRFATAGDDGLWTMPPDPSGFVLRPGMSGEAVEYDSDGDYTRWNWSVPNPFIEAAPYSDWIHARGWLSGTSIKLEIDDPSNGTGADYTEDGVMGQAPWNPGDPNDIAADFRWPDQFTPGPGYIITMTGDVYGNPVTKSLTVSTLSVSKADAATDTVIGIADPGTQVHVCANIPNNCVTRWVTPAGDTGSWTAKYGEEGNPPDDVATVDLLPGSNGWASQDDGDGDITWYDWNVPNPNFRVRANDDQVQAWEWTQGDTLTLTIDNPNTFNNPDYTATQSVEWAPWDTDHTQTYVSFNLGGFYDILAGDEVSLSNGITPKTTTVTDLVLTAIDVDADTVTGQASPDSSVGFSACDATHCSNRYVAAENSSSWTVDFSALGNAQDWIDIKGGTWIDSDQCDSDGDCTNYGMNAPRIEAHPQYDLVYGFDWPRNTELALTINGGVVATTTMTPSPWDPNYYWADFPLDGFDLLPGQVVTISGGGFERTMTVLDPQVTDIDLQTDTISGTANPGNRVQVCANIPNNCVSRWNTTDSRGNWRVDYSTWSDPSDTQETFTLQPGSNGWAYEEGETGDQTWANDWQVNQFTPRVSSIDRLDGNPTTDSSVRFGVTFSKPVTGVDASDFGLISNGVYWAAITGVTGSESDYTVTVRTGFGNGTLRLILIDNGSITDMNGGHLVGLYSYNGNFTNGQPYAILRPDGTLPRAETLYFNGQQWGSVVCWNPYSNNCNNAMAITQQDNARVTVFETPYIFNMLDGKVYPLLADGPWSWNADLTELTFSLNSAAHWSDGSPVTAEDVAYTFATNVRIGTGVDGYIDTIEAVDAHTVRVKAKLDENGKAVNPLMVAAYLSTNYVVQKAWTQKLEERTGGDMDAFLNDPANDFVSSGPYTLFFTDDTKVVLMRDDNYWGKNGSMWGELPAPEYLAHVIYGDNDSANTAFKNGLVDVSQMFIENVQDLWLVDHLPVSTYLPDAPYQIGASLPTAFYNLNSPGLDQVAIRKAIAIAVDYNTIVADAMSNQSITFEQVPRSLMNPSASEQALYDHAAVADLQWTGNDIEGAKALLDAAGIIDTNGDGWREYNGQKLSYIATCPNGWSDWQAAIELVAAAGQEIGIDITTNYPEWSDYQNVVTNWPLPVNGYDIFMMWSDGAGPTQPWGRASHLMSSELAGTTGNWTGNWGGYSNPAVDALLRAIPGETDPAQLKADYTELTRIYLTDVPSFTVMYRPQSFHTVNETIWTGFPRANDGTNPIVPPLDLTDGYSIAGLYNLQTTPAAFNKVAPANGVTGQPATVTLSWGTSPNAKFYEYCYSTSDKNCNSWVSAGTAISMTLNSLAPNTTYYWQVRAINHYGTTYADGKKQILWSFKTGTVPSSFNKTAPVNGATSQPANPTLSWVPSAGAIAYLYCYDTSNDGTCTTWFDNGTGTSVTLSGLAKNTTYYWQVKAVNSFGTTYANGAKSAFWSFKTGTLPASFYKTAPANGATGQLVNPTLSWGASSGTTAYWYCYDTTNDNACTNWVNIGTATRTTLSSLSKNTIYYWQVKAVNSFGTSFANGSSTAFWSFKTK
jgi:peptide/nickel transport system substrate-binding protein